MAFPVGIVLDVFFISFGNKAVLINHMGLIHQVAFIGII